MNYSSHELPGGPALVDRDVGQVTEDDVKMFLLLLVLVKPLEGVVDNNFVFLPLVLVEDISTSRPSEQLILR